MPNKKQSRKKQIQKQTLKPNEIHVRNSDLICFCTFRGKLAKYPGRPPCTNAENETYEQDTENFPKTS